MRTVLRTNRVTNRFANRDIYDSVLGTVIRPVLGTVSRTVVRTVLRTVIRFVFFCSVAAVTARCHNKNVPLVGRPDTTERTVLRTVCSAVVVTARTCRYGTCRWSVSWRASGHLDTSYRQGICSIILEKGGRKQAGWLIDESASSSFRQGMLSKRFIEKRRQAGRQADRPIQQAVRQRARCC